jgi:hypothetical protein
MNLFQYLGIAGRTFFPKAQQPQRVRASPLLRFHDHKCDNNVKIYFKDTRLEYLDWICRAKDGVQRRALVKTILRMRAPQNAGNNRLFASQDERRSME